MREHLLTRIAILITALTTLSGCNPLATSEDQSYIDYNYLPGLATGKHPDTLELVSGDQQNGVAGSPLSSELSVRVRDVLGVGVPGTDLTITVLSGGGSVSSSILTTDKLGIARFTWTLGPVPGANSLKVEGLTSLPGNVKAIAFTATGVLGAPAQLVATGGTGQVLNPNVSPSPFEVTLRDANLNLIPGASIDWSVSTGGASINVNTNPTDADGKSMATLGSGSTPGTHTVIATVHSHPTISASFTFNWHSSPTLSYAGASGTSGTIFSAMSVTPTTLSANGSSITNCTISPALPTGLSINSSTCVISGTPTQALSSTNFTITVTNAIGSSSASVALSIAAIAPSLSYAGASGTSGTIFSSMSVTPTTLSANGSSITNCTISPALPTGLSINSSTCVISGTPQKDFNSTFNVTVTNAIGTTTATVSMQALLNCPAGFASVSRNSSVGVSNSFCIAKYEMRCSGSSCPTGTPSTSAIATPASGGTPWVSISIQNSQLACLNLGSNYDLISNAEWMATAREIESLPSNWSLGSVGQGTLSIGWSNATSLQGTTNSSCLYNTGPDTCGSTGTFEWKRTHALSSAEELWDFSGNADEWVDWSMNSGVQATPSLCSGAWAWTEIPNLNCAGLAAADYLPGNPAGISASSYNSTYRLGQLYIPGTAGLYAVRGGKFNIGSMAGIYNLAIRMDGLASDRVGFRCVYRPYVPTFTYSGATGTSGSVGSAMTIAPTSFNNNGSAITNCTISPALPSGLSINSSTCIISGTPTQAVSATTYTITATNAYGQASALATLSVAGFAPTISYTTTAIKSALGAQGESMTFTPTLSSGGHSITNCTITPSLPTGLSINTTTCVISGTPTVKSPSTTYTVTVTNPVGSASTSFSFFVCPTNYLPIGENTSHYNAAFCVAKYEMKCTGSACATVVPARTGPTVNTTATSQAAGSPWYGMTFAMSKTACENLNGGLTPTRYTIINNSQWMNIAREIELNNSNWSSGTKYVGMMNTGHSDGVPNNSLSADVDSLPYSGTGNSASNVLNAGWEQKRTHALESGKFIWDLAGNMDEWVDWQVARSSRAYRFSDGGVIASLLNFTDLNTNISSGPMISSLWFPAGGTMLGTDGYGKYLGGTTSDSIDPYIRRGGNWSKGGSGIYSTDARYDDSDPSIGFRCVYIP